ncbi:MAG: penicillin-binding protein 2 [Actinobacteria bacterium]|nr:penicillin-binding protein 2 [Actinomycetota bacterium]
MTEPYRLTPQLALRVAILGGIVLATFAVLFLRLWALQILSGTQYLRTAQNNQLRALRLQAARGAILDRNGRVLVRNTAGLSVQIWPADLPKDRAVRARMLRRLAFVIKVPYARLQREIAARSDDPLTPLTVKRGIHDDQLYHLEEKKEAFPGVVVAQSYLREYPYRALAAQLVGHVGEASQEELDGNPELRLGDEVGKAGIESAYDGFLRGEAGSARLRVDSLGRPRGEPELSDIPVGGRALRLTIDVRLQRAAEQALRYGIRLAKGNEAWNANGGALVALDPRDGAVLALASNPTYKPSLFVGKPDLEKLAPFLDEGRAAKENFPSLNRAIEGRYPPGSTFKPVTALAAMEEHLVSPYASLDCTPSYESHGQTFDNWTPNYDQPMSLPTALATSCDTYFYQLGEAFYDLPPERGQPLQLWAGRLGFGKTTGLDVGAEAPGLLPTIDWRRRYFTRERYPRTWEQERLWKPGDSIQLAIGQKDIQVTPLQMARFYALVANGGKLVTPHVVDRAEQPMRNGRRPIVLQRFTPPAPQPVDVDPGALAAVREGLLLATHAGFGTSSGVFGSFPVSIAGKTGTAEKAVNGRLEDQSWWCGYGPTDRTAEIVVCALIENGGHGGSAAAPAALKVFEQYFGRRGTFVAPTETD